MCSYSLGEYYSSYDSLKDSYLSSKTQVTRGLKGSTSSSLEPDKSYSLGIIYCVSSVVFYNRLLTLVGSFITYPSPSEDSIKVVLRNFP